MLMAMIYLVVGLSDFNLAILAGDIGFIVTAVFFVPEIKKVMRTRESKELLRLESPLNWLKSMTTFFVLSLLSSFVYGFANVPNVGVEFNLIIQYLFIFCVIFFLFGLLYTVRIIWFIIDPASKTNILAGKVMKTIVASGTKIILVSFISFFQIINGLMLYLILNLFFVAHVAITPFHIVYLFTLVLSFIALIPCLHLIIFRLNKENRIRDWIVLFCLFSPWIALITYNLLLEAGIVHL